MKLGARCSVSWALAAFVPAVLAQPLAITDLASAEAGVQRIRGSVGEGRFGVPVAGGHDLDGDRFADSAFAAMIATPLGREQAGQVFIVFGNGEVRGALDTAAGDQRILTILGDQDQENTGSEIWVDEVTGDGLGDLLICRQNHSPHADRIGAGALTIVPGQPALRELATGGQPIDLRSPAAALGITTLLGATAGKRLGIWGALAM